MRELLWLCVCLFLLAVATCLQAEVAVFNFDDPAVWKLNRDGGGGVEVSRDTEFARQGTAVRIRYKDAPPHWGNLVAPCRVPKDARAVHFWLYKHSAAQQAAMHLWLFETDGDGWLQRIPLGKADLSDLAVGWHEVSMPVAGFQFEPRGARTRDMTSVDRMLIGCNYGDLEVTIDSMTWETDSPAKALPLPKTAGLKVERGPRGNIGVLDMGASLPDGFKTTHPPAKIAEALRGGGFGATILLSGDLADATLLTRSNLDCVVLPFGPFFPKRAKEPFLTYLKSGGSFLSTDGYTFDRLLELTDQGWSATGAERTAEEMSQPAAAPAGAMNTRTGIPGDAMTFAPEQIGVFDPTFTLEHATELRPSPEWIPDSQLTNLRYQLSRPATGFSAVGLTGCNSPVFPPVYRRWIPVLDAYGGGGSIKRGTALSLMYNYAGPFPRSCWAFTGLTSGDDLFLNTPQRRHLLCEVVGRLTERVFLHELTSDAACYRPGETATVKVQVSNYGSTEASATVSLTVAEREVTKRPLTLPPCATQSVEMQLAVSDLKADYCPLRAILRRDDRAVDTIDSGFCVWSRKVMDSGPKIGWKDNYMTVDGRPHFLVGSNQTGMMYFSANENPAVWDRDFRTMCEHNLHLLRILHFSPYSAGGYEGKPTNNPLDLKNRPERFCRQMDAIVQLAQKHRVAIFLSLHDWMDVALTEEQLAAQADWNRFWADRYRNVPGIFYDVQNEPSVDVPNRPDVVALWNHWLKERYRTDEALREAWPQHPPEAALSNVPLTPGGGEWNDVRTADHKRFEAELLNRWVKANVEGIKAGDPDALTCVGYLPSMPPADRILGVRHTDFSNMHFYGSVNRFPQEFKSIDRRVLGKGFSLGECGAQEAHDLRVQGSYGDVTAASTHRFQTYVHYGAAMGAAFMANWSLKDFDEMVFPWGLMRHGSYIAKPWLHTLTQESLLLSLFEPKYESPQVFVLAPDRHRIGPRFNELHDALARSIELMLDQRVNFGIVNEEDLDRLPESAKALLWPIPYCPDDATFERVLGWVKAGGRLYLSGDVSFDGTRKPTRAQRRQLLNLPEATPSSPFATPEEAWREPPLETSVGKGKVFYAPYPLELRPRGSDKEVYARFLAAESHIRIEPQDAPVRALSIPTRDGGRLTMLARTTDGEDRIAITLPDAEVTVELAGGGFSFVLTDAKGSVLAAESQGAIIVGGRRLAQAKGHFGVCSLDGKDLRQSQQLLLLPHQTERVDVSGLSLTGDSRCFIGDPCRRGAKDIATSEAVVFPPGPTGYVAVIAPATQMRDTKGRVARMLETR